MSVHGIVACFETYSFKFQLKLSDMALSFIR